MLALACEGQSAALDIQAAASRIGSLIAQSTRGYVDLMLLSLAGLSAVPKHLYEAAAIDRAGPLYTFFRITLPLVAPILMIAIIFRTMEAFKTFDLAYILTSQPTTEVISIRLYKMAFQEWQTGLSCALAYIVLIMVIAITNIYVKYLNKVKER